MRIVMMMTMMSYRGDRLAVPPMRSDAVEVWFVKTTFFCFRFEQQFLRPCHIGRFCTSN